jgi:CHAD domain-containing protein
METNRLPQSNVAALPPPDAAVVGPVACQQGISPLPALHPSPLHSHHSDATQRLSLPVDPRTINSACQINVAIGTVLAEALQTRWQYYREQLRTCQAEFSEEAVHQLRVATRRLIAQLVLLSCVLRNPALEKMRRILKRRLAALGELRDTHVQRTFITREVARFPELVLLRKTLERQERRLVKAAAAKVGRCKTRKLEKLVETLSCELGADARGARVQNQLASAVLRATANAFAEAVERRQAIDLADLRTIHQTRVAFKRFRYMVESLSPRVTGLSKRQLRALAYYQRKMGIIQDLEVLQACVVNYIAEHKGAEALLRPFGRYLRQRRSRALRSFLNTADRLFAFWPPARLMGAKEPVATRNAA